MTINLDANVSLQSILIKIGFLPNGDGLQFDFGNCKLKAIQGINQYFQDGFNFVGYYITGRSAGELDFFLPLQVESYEQGLSVIAYYLRNADFKNKPDWLNEGLALREHLPWLKETKAYNENPNAIIEHEWFRVLVNKLKLIISTSTNEDVTTFSFDGIVLTVVCNNEIFVVSGLGKNWQSIAKVKTKSLEFLPKRIPDRDIPVYIWKDNLHIGNRVFKLELENKKALPIVKP
ncbi:hypothetical protein [Flavobacterium sp. DSR3-2]|uniref:hypothetical protein n=1 Tax=Flavobacterium sp. DSR3-2 TaxID=2804634 RepID=UPI003CFB234D